MFLSRFAAVAVAAMVWWSAAASAGGPLRSFEYGFWSGGASAWASRNEAAVAMAAQTLGEIWESERFTFTTLSVALRAIRTLVAASSLPQD